MKRIEFEDAVVVEPAKVSILDEMPVGSVIDYEGTEVPAGWEEVETIKSKVIKTVINTPIEPSDISITGVGFKPRAITAIMCVNDTIYESNGYVDETKTSQSIYRWESDAKRNYDGALVVYSNYSSWANSAVLKRFDDDGFTLTWRKTGTPPSGEMVIIFLCEK